MINAKIIQIASNTKYQGLVNNFTHKASIRNSICGDFITIEILADKNKILTMRYETESCILCEASASLLANKIKNFKIKDLKKVEKLKDCIKKKKIIPKLFNGFKNLTNKTNQKRLNCVILPLEGLLKAIKIEK